MGFEIQAIPLFRATGEGNAPAGKHARVLAFQFRSIVGGGESIRFHSWDRHGSEHKGMPVSIRADWRISGILDPMVGAIVPIDSDLGPLERELYDSQGRLIGCELRS